MRGFVAVVSVLNFAIISAPASAQDAEKSPDTETRVDEEIVVEGKTNFGVKLERGFEAFRAGDFETAAAYFKSVRLQEFRNKSDGFAVALQFMQDGRYPRASYGATNFRKNDIWRRQAYAILYYMEGMSKRGMGEISEASTALLRALDMNPKHFDARADYALVKIELGEPNKAKKHLKRLRKDLRKCDEEKDAAHCMAIQERLQQVEFAYDNAVAG